MINVHNRCIWYIESELLQVNIPLVRSNTFLNILLKPVPFREPLLAGSVTTASPTGKSPFMFLATSVW